VLEITIVVVQNGGVVEVGVCVGVSVAIEVGVFVGVLMDVGVDVEVGVAVGVEVAVAVKVCEGVTEAVGVDVNVATPAEVDVGVGDAITEVEVGPGLDFGVDEGGGGKYTNVFVGLAKAVFVTNAVVAGVAVRVVVTNVPDVGVVKDASAVVGSGVMVECEAPGVRKLSIHAGFVRMAGSTGSMNPSGLCVRKSLFGSSLDSALASSSQRGAKRSAHLPASRIARSPNKRMRAMTDQSRFSFSVALMGKSIEWQAHVKRGARTHLFVMTGAFDPDAPVVGVDNTAGDGKPQPGTTAFEFGLARRVQMHFAGLVEFFEDQLVILRVDADACIFDCDFDLRSYNGILNGPTGDGNASTIRRVFDGIADHVVENLVKQVFICVNNRQVR